MCHSKDGLQIYFLHFHKINKGSPNETQTLVGKPLVLSYMLHLLSCICSDMLAKLKNTALG